MLSYFFLYCYLNVVFSQPYLQYQIFFLWHGLCYWWCSSRTVFIWFIEFFNFNIPIFIQKLNILPKLLKHIADFLTQAFNWLLYLIQLFVGLLFEVIDHFEKYTFEFFVQCLAISIFLYSVIGESYELWRNHCLHFSYFLWLCIIIFASVGIDISCIY
jgi:hypothetical protein